ncbi:MAG: hypothetical protein GY764_03240 [Halieaceae bacterium]|nr:hypothetical protein [Halieaceae bacterium]
MALQLDSIVDWIDDTFGDSKPRVGASDMDALQKILGGNDYQSYLQDQVNRQIIRDYLLNAVVLGVISDADLQVMAPQLECEEGRATVALYMLMSSVDDARELPAIIGDMGQLKPLNLEPESPPYIKLVTS